jgi:glutathione synthase/RimK-type ligase-like ATP-grasp enzyme
MLMTRFTQLIQAYDALGPGDVFVGQIPASPLKAVMLTDLAARGVRLLPSATAQTVHGSKCAQAFLLAAWMVPHTRVIARRKALLDTLGDYHRRKITVVVTKHDHLHCGHGVRKWENLDMLYSCLSLDERHFPFVVQPLQAVAADVRVILVGDYQEAYARHNPDGFRMNLAAGGSSRPHALTEEQHDLCRRVMARARMPYAHIDLMITQEGDTYLSEISLNGGLQGARVARVELEGMKRARLEALAMED